MSPKAILTIGSALAALAVSHLGLMAYFLVGGAGEPMHDAKDWASFEIGFILPAVAAVAISAWVFARDKGFQRRNRFLQACGISLLSYPIFFLVYCSILLIMATFNADGSSMKIGSDASFVLFVGGMATIFGFFFTIIPAVLVEFAVVTLARRGGQQMPGASL